MNDDSRPGPPPVISPVAPIYRALADDDAGAGGRDYTLAEAAAARELRERYPEIGQLRTDTRAFLERAVSWAVDSRGIVQVLDIGCGLPEGAARPMHAIARDHDPWTRVVYADYDRRVVTHAVAHLVCDDPERTAAIEADARAPGTLLTRTAATGVLDLGRPVLVLLGAVLHSVVDDDAPGPAMGSLIAGLAPGSVVALTHVAHGPGVPRSSRSAALERIYAEMGAPCQVRTPEQVQALMPGLEPEPPGVADAHTWWPGPRRRRPRPVPRWDELRVMAGVGHVPHP